MAQLIGLAAFKASSGNECAAKIYSNQAIDVNWRDEPSEADMQESAELLMKAVGGTVSNHKITNAGTGQVLVQGHDPARQN